MKKLLVITPAYYILSVMFISLIFFSSCDENSDTTETDQYEGPSGSGICDFSLYGPIENSDGSMYIEVSFSDGTGSDTLPVFYYYFLILISSNGVIQPDINCGQFSPFYNMKDTIEYDFYSSDVPAGSYQVLIYASRNSTFNYFYCYYLYWEYPDSLDHSAIIGNITVKWEDSAYASCSGEWYYAFAAQTQGPYYGISASIKTRYGKLCGHGTLDSAAHACAYVDISFDSVINVTDTIHYWAQAGYIRKRLAGDIHYTYGRYFEIQNASEPYRYIDSISQYVPQEGEFHGYMLILNDVNGTWLGIYDGNAWFEWIGDTCWQSRGGNVIQWTAEIYRMETDMAGTVSDPCIIDSCMIDTLSGGYQHFLNANITSNNIGSYNWSQWFIRRVSATYLEIWDLIPLP